MFQIKFKRYFIANETIRPKVKRNIFFHFALKRNIAVLRIIFAKFRSFFKKLCGFLQFSKLTKCEKSISGNFANEIFRGILNSAEGR